ncbi:SRPBCC family protein [Actinocatenispora comari]|uniref:Carbon monoxide dehydrogenase subunit G family protein n=1 Tax=Actinocatenispora comari TaxID=2807577 RepID=A0A8J4A8T1_9ACTN|nr:SRPBCC family protein [Actinocatenispora comari]GIL25415.1 carbon monoxide dehydrogenase subunit G family protein [Actinocatenispora comari]
MKINQEFTVGIPIEQAWQLLTDLERIAPCLPGAQLTGVERDVYSGTVRVKVGPVVAKYSGTARFAEKDDGAHRAAIDAKGRDSRGAGNAAALITAQLRADGDRTVVALDTDLTITGKIAQFGSGMIAEVSGKLLGQFVECLEGKLRAGDDAVAPSTADSPGAAEDTTAAPAEAPSGERSAAAADGAAPATTPAATPIDTGARATAEGESSAAPDSGPDTGTRTGAVATSTRRVLTPEREAEPLDLMKVAGGSVYKRLMPVVAVLLVVAAIIVYLVVRR